MIHKPENNGRLPLGPRRNANDFQFLLFLWLVAHGLLWLPHLVLE